MPTVVMNGEVSVFDTLVELPVAQILQVGLASLDTVYCLGISLWWNTCNPSDLIIPTRAERL